MLTLWISPDFANKASLILQIMAVAALTSGLAQVPYTMLQGKGRADIPAKLHLVELPIYLALIYFLAMNYGAQEPLGRGLMQITGDMVVLYYINARAYGDCVTKNANTSEVSVKSHG